MSTSSTGFLGDGDGDARADRYLAGGDDAVLLGVVRRVRPVDELGLEALVVVDGFLAVDIDRLRGLFAPDCSAATGAAAFCFDGVRAAGLARLRQISASNPASPAATAATGASQSRRGRSPSFKPSLPRTSLTSLCNMRASSSGSRRW